MPRQIWCAYLEFPSGTKKVFYSTQDFKALGEHLKSFCLQANAFCMDVIPIPPNPESQPAIRTLVKPLLLRGPEPITLKPGEQVQIYDLAQVLIEYLDDEEQDVN